MVQTQNETKGLQILIFGHKPFFDQGFKKSIFTGCSQVLRNLVIWNPIIATRNFGILVFRCQLGNEILAILVSIYVAANTSCWAHDMYQLTICLIHTTACYKKIKPLHLVYSTFVESTPSSDSRT